jgi:hypothetical protein
MIPTTPLGRPPADADLVPSPSTGAHPTPAAASFNHEAVLNMTAEVFPGAKIELGTGTDPEVEGDEYYVVSVTTAGEVKELVAKDGQWHHRLWDVVPKTASFYRLLMDVA